MPKIVYSDYIVQNKIGSALIDNLMLSHALRPLLGYKLKDVSQDDILGRKIGSEFLLYDDHGLLSRHGKKWNYPLNDAFRFAIDIYSLGQLIEAVIIFDKLFVDCLWIDRWGAITQKDDQVILPKIAACLNPIVHPVIFSPNERLTAIANAIWKANIYANSDSFQEFMRLLSITSVESAFIHMSHAYYQTGYSDEEIFPRNEFILSEYFGSLIQKSVDSTLIDNFNQFKTDIIGLWDEIVEAEVLKKTDHHRGDVHDKTYASKDVMRNAIASLFHLHIAKQYGLTYFPHFLRSSFVLFDQISSSKGLVPTAQKVMRSIDIVRKGRVDGINSFYENEVIDVKIPSLFSMVLQNVDSPSSILSTAIQIRNTKEAKLFRKWSMQIDKQLEEGDINIKKLSKEVGEIQKFLATWAGDPTETKDGFEFGLALGPLQITKPIPWTGFSISRKPHLIFLQRMAQVNDQTGAFAQLVEKLFGKTLGDIYRKYQAAISAFQRPPTENTEESHSPLKWNLSSIYRDIFIEHTWNSIMGLLSDKLTEEQKEMLLKDLNGMNNKPEANE